MIRIALAQINSCVGDLKNNYYRIARSIALAKSRGAQLVIFPEMATTGYPPEDLLFKKHFTDEVADINQKIALLSDGICVIVGTIENSGQRKPFDSALICANKKILGVYHKVCLPNYGVFDEKRHFTAGTNPLVLVLNGLSIGLTICEDIWHDDGPLNRLLDKLS